MASQPSTLPAPRKSDELRRRYEGQGYRKGKLKAEARVRPTHFIAIPLNTNPHLRHHISSFQSHILSAREGQNGGYIRGLHPSIAINPVRFHLTIAVMGLRDDTKESGSGLASVPDNPAEREAEGKEKKEEKTVSQALELLRSLKPQIREILSSQPPPSSSSSAPLAVRLEHLEVMRLVNPPKPRASTSTANSGQPASGPDSAGSGSGPARGAEDERSQNEMWADVLYLAPKEDGMEGVKLRKLGDLINSTFRNEGYLTDTRPLKLHCTILNTSHRKPSRDRKLPFCYSDILACEEGMRSLFAQAPSLSPLPPPLSPHSGPLISTTTGTAAAAATPTSSTPPPRTRPGNPQPTITITSARNPNPNPRPPRNQPLTKITLGTLPPYEPTNTITTTEKRRGHEEWLQVEVREIGLWKMGSRDGEGRYVSCGGVELG